MKCVTTIAILIFTQLLVAQNRVSQIDSVLNSLYSEGKINGNFLVAEKGKIIYRHNYGYANELTKERLEDYSIFELASCSKQFTAMAIMILKEKGKLKLDDDFSKYIPELSNYKNISIRNLLNHTGGLPEYLQFMDAVFDKTHIASNKDLVKLLSKYQPNILFAPNTKYQYSNTGYALLATIIENVSGGTYSKFLDKYIFTPLKMQHTFVYNRRLHPQKIKNYAYGYVYSDSLKKLVLPDELNETRMVVWLDGMVGDGAVNSTMIDLLKWDRALYTNKLLSSSGMKEMFETATLSDQSKTHYGFGWGIIDDADMGRITRHTGGWPGYLTQIDRHITKDKTIIILQNHDNVVNPVETIRSILYNKVLPVKSEKHAIVLPTEHLQKLVGIYEVQPGFEAKISLEGNQLYGQLTGQNAYPIFAETEMLFFLKVADIQIRFEKDLKDEITKMSIIQNGTQTEAKRIK